jgi:hypothetical protein
MATLLKKDITRESTEVFDDRNIMVTLTEDQKITMKLKGMKSGAVSIDIIELYKDLKGIKSDDEKPDGPISVVKNNKPQTQTGGVMIDLNELRSQNAISTLDVHTLSKFDGLIKNLIDATKTKK